MLTMNIPQSMPHLLDCKAAQTGASAPIPIVIAFHKKGKLPRIVAFSEL
jgi:hypothetical protein